MFGSIEKELHNEQAQNICRRAFISFYWIYWKIYWLNQYSYFIYSVDARMVSCLHLQSQQGTKLFTKG